ncbi:MAG: hypothetical protein ACM3QV_00085 [Caulobacteraceae bacterium]
MFSKPADTRITGTVIGYRRWNPFSTMAKALVKTCDGMIQIPIDYRQLNIIAGEHPIGSTVTLWQYNGEWHIESGLVETYDRSPEIEVLPFKKMRV